jgi:DNA-binding CsgD family transcriptional regulator
VLHGRDIETARLAQMLEEARAGQASSLVISGSAGLGKSALLEETAARATDTRLLRTAGLESESPLAFAALHRLLRPVMDLAVDLPPPQARALRVAFGEVDGDHIDPFLVALATLSLLTEAAETGPVLCLIDDAHWLDVASSDALLFAARRLLAEPVVMLFAARDDEDNEFAPGDVAVMRLDGLTGDAVGSLLRERTDRVLSDQVVEQLAAGTGGNPLALVELPAQLSAGQLGGTSSLPETLPLSGRVERTFLDRCRRLSQPAQTLMLLASADDSGRLAVVLSAAEVLSVPAATLAEVESARLLVVDVDTVRVRHPLVRSAVYQAATGAERRSAHAALAKALGATGDVDRQTWHRAAAANGPDDALAADLEATGRRAERRGGHDSAAAAYHRAAQLTVADEDRARRLFDAARTAYAGGQVARAVALLEESRLIADDLMLCADIARLRGRIEVMVGSAVDAHRIFIRAAHDVAALDQERAAEMAALAGIMRGHGIDSGTTLPDGVVDTAPSATDSVRLRCFKLLMRSTTSDVAGDRAAAMALVQEALAIGLDADDRDLWANLANMALHLGDDQGHRRYFDAMLSAARADGAVMEVLYALHRVALSELAAGDWRAVHRSADDAMSLARSVGHPGLAVTPSAILTLLAALEGDTDYDTLLAATEDAVERHHLGIMDAVVADVLRWAKGTRASNANANAEAFHHLEQIRVPAAVRLVTAVRVTSAVNAGELDRASTWTTEVEELAEATGLPWAYATATFGRALLAEPADARDYYDVSLVHHALAHRAFDEACTELAYGEHLRRTGQRVEARAHLNRALETFRDLRAEPLVARATRELRASGETARQRNVSTLVQLTPTELHIAQLVSQGMSNKDVAAQCFISPRTVAFHLRNVFTKIGVASRGELAQLALD